MMHQADQSPETVRKPSAYRTASGITFFCNHGPQSIYNFPITKVRSLPEYCVGTETDMAHDVKGDRVM